MNINTVRILVVDDSAYIRKVFSEMLNRSENIEVVGTARNGLEALEKTEQLNPDVVLVDVFMPEMDGVEYVQEQMKRKPIPIMVCSSAGENEELVIAAMEAGAIEYVRKPTAQASEKIFSIENDIIDKVHAISRIRHFAAPVLSREISLDGKLASLPGELKGRIEAICIGVSTGGPQSLRYLLPRFPADFPLPLAIVLHIPEGYTGPFAERLNQLSEIEVLEAEEGLEMKPGRAILAKAGYHLLLVKENQDKVICHLDQGTSAASYHIPSVDSLFHSASTVYGDKVLGIVLTGMGRDGVEGSAWIKQGGGIIFTESEESSVIFGMPRSVIEAGLSDKIVSLNDLMKSITEII
jgi:two-component system, chemotaxis family, protein-glutamate methylesterase/glutaminase